MTSNKKSVRIKVRRRDKDKTFVPETELAEALPDEKDHSEETEIESNGETLQVETETSESQGKISVGQEANIDWQDRALRLQAEIDNYRKRQQKLAEERIAQAKANVLLKFIEVVDNLERALAHVEPDTEDKKDLELVYADMLRILHTEDVEQIESQGKAFDPDWHEAVAMVPAASNQDEDMLVIGEERRGYTFAGRLLRPARVVVAKK